MCGILITSDKTQVSTIKHRGIEKKILEVDGKLLVHHRLPIQTVVGDGLIQPLDLGNSRYLLFNGEIFNYKGNFKSDSEYLLNLFYKRPLGWFSGEEFLEEINSWDGFWSIIIFDGNQNEYIAFTDPLGKKSLYYDERGFICSEIKGLLYPDRDLDKRFLSTTSKFGYSIGSNTPWIGIQKLIPNTINLFKYKKEKYERVVVVDNYFNWDGGKDFDPETVHEDVRELLIDSVKKRLVSRKYTVSLLLSGGLDSSIIASILKRLDSKVDFYTISNGEEEFVNILSEYLQLPVKKLEYSLSSNNLSDSENLEILCKWNESPVDLGSVFPQYHLFKAIKNNDSENRVVLSGDGADELFGGYTRSREYDSQYSDIFDELSYYHLPRLDKMSMAHTLELRNPFLSHDLIRFALKLPRELRTDKRILKESFKDFLPREILNRDKKALKNEIIVEDKFQYIRKLVELFENNWMKFF